MKLKLPNLRRLTFYLRVVFMLNVKFLREGPRWHMNARIMFMQGVISIHSVVRFYLVKKLFTTGELSPSHSEHTISNAGIIKLAPSPHNKRVVRAGHVGTGTTPMTCRWFSVY